MVRRSLAIAVFAVFALACAATPALALDLHPLWSQDVTGDAQGGSRLAPGTDGSTVVWAADQGGGVTDLLAARYSRAGRPLPGGPVALVSGITGLDGWFVAGDGSLNVTAVWKAGGTVYAKRVDLGTGSATYGPVIVCTDGAVAASRGSGSTASLTGTTADGDGGVWVWCTASPAKATGDTLLNHVTSTGTLGAADPGLAVPGGTVECLAVDAGHHAFVLLVGPGRRSITVQRYDTNVTPDWSSAVSPYNPLLGEPATIKTPVGITAVSAATVAWREGVQVKMQRFSAEGVRTLMRPAAVTMAAGAVKLAADGFSGCYLVGPSASGIVARHLDGGGREIGAPGRVLSVPGVGTPQVDAVTANRCGDLTVAYSDAASATAPGIARLTASGLWQSYVLATPPELFSAAAQDGAGGAYVLGAGKGAALVRCAETGTALTLRPLSALVQYGKSVIVSGYLTDGGEPAAAGELVTLLETRGGSSRDRGTATTDGQGFYRATITPTSNADWSAVANEAASTPVAIGVMPRVTLKLANSISGTRLTEIFSGSVAPNHAGKRVLVQKAVGSGWRTVASGRLDRRSHYRVHWRLPYRTATYKVRVILPKHGDHAEGASPTGTVRVRVRRG